MSEHDNGNDTDTVALTAVMPVAGGAAAADTADTETIDTVIAGDAAADTVAIDTSTIGAGDDGGVAATAVMPVTDDGEDAVADTAVMGVPSSGADSAANATEDGTPTMAMPVADDDPDVIPAEPDDFDDWRITASFPSGGTAMRHSADGSPQSADAGHDADADRDTSDDAVESADSAGTAGDGTEPIAAQGIPLYAVQSQQGDEGDASVPRTGQNERNGSQRADASSAERTGQDERYGQFGRSGNEAPAAGTGGASWMQPGPQSYVQVPPEPQAERPVTRKTGPSAATIVLAVIMVVLGGAMLVLGMEFPLGAVGWFTMDPRVAVAIGCALIGGILVLVSIIWALAKVVHSMRHPKEKADGSPMR